jgi:valyl-tRNA synthetase
MSEFAKQYEPKISEAQSQALWKKAEVSLPKEWTTGKTFYMPLPPPNVTGKLHIGHSLMVSIEDIIARYHRMKGDTTLWLPGTDHAGIATQTKVEEKLMKTGVRKWDIGREAFIKECEAWVDEYGGHIHRQVDMMWATLDMSKERYTLDTKYHSIVEKTFVDLYNKWIIYRGEYMVNYSPALESVISDIEVEHIEIEERMYYINYFVAGSDKELLIATTRPETLLADQAVAVHPKDKRYKKLIGKSVILPIVNKEIPIIADPMVDMEFWTGVVKITPAHDPADFETGKRHGLRLDYRVIDKNGTMTTDAWVFAGLRAAEEARSNIVELLKSKGNLVKIEPYTHKVGFCEKGKCRIESVVSTQWFVKASVMAEKVIAGYKKKDFVILPDRFNKTFEDWIYNLRDWCISRQLWWGHQIPAYYHVATGELLGVTLDPSELIATYGQDNIRRDDDVHHECGHLQDLIGTSILRANSSRSSTPRMSSKLDMIFSSSGWSVCSSWDMNILERLRLKPSIFMGSYSMKMEKKWVRVRGLWLILLRSYRVILLMLSGSRVFLEILQEITWISRRKRSKNIPFSSTSSGILSDLPGWISVRLNLIEQHWRQRSNRIKKTSFPMNSGSSLA